MSSASLPLPGGLFARRKTPGKAAPRKADATPGGPSPRLGPGPVLMGDIHGQRNGAPLLLLLWQRWEQEADAD